MKLARTLPLLALAVAGALAACDKSSPPAPSGEGSAAPPQAKAAEPDQAEQAKLGAAIECLNRHSGNIFETRDGYLESVDPATGASRTDRAPVLTGLYGLEPCRSQVKEAGALTPASAELDRASAAYVAALEALATRYEALRGYYQKGEHLDDQGKKAATLHPEVMAGFDAFAAAHRDLDGQVRTLNRKKRVDALAAREKAEGRNLEVIVDTMMLEAETLIAMVTTPGGDGAALDAQAAAYGKLVDEFDAYAGAHPDEAKQRGSITNLGNYSKTFLAASKVVARKLADKAEPTDSERIAAVDQYNYLVDNYNNH